MPQRPCPSSAFSFSDIVCKGLNQVDVVEERGEMEGGERESRVVAWKGAVRGG